MINISDSQTKQWISSLSFVDLAGSERQMRTGNEGLRLKESVAINSSLMTLGRCLEALRWNHDNKPKRKRHIPFRQAKITHAFKNAFLGSGSTVLLVNVSASARDYEETVHVLKYASLATALPCSSHASRAIMNAEPAQKKRKESRKEPVPEPILADSPADHVEYAEMAEENENLTEEVERLKSELFESERRAAEMEARIREEVAGEMTELLREMESSYHMRLEAEVSAARNAASSVENTNHNKLEEEIEDLKQELKDTEMELDDAKREIEAMEGSNEKNEEVLVKSLKSMFEEEKTQLEANAAMEKETLEIQLDRQRQENEALKLSLKRMKEVTRVTLKKYNANLSPGTLALSNFLEDSENKIPRLEEEEENYQSLPAGEYDVDTSDFVIKSSVVVSSTAQKENVPVEATRKDKSRSKKQKKSQKRAPLVQATPVARRTRAGRKACQAIDNVH